MPSRNGPWWRRLTLRDVIFFTLPPMALAVWFIGAAVLDYHRVRQFDDWWSAQTSVRKFAWYRLRSALRTPRMAALDQRLTAEDESKPLLRLFVDRHDWDRIDSDVGAHWGEWIDCQIADGNDLHDAELRFRGDGSAHWSTEKKSFTLKTKRDQLYKGFRSMAFSVKDVLPQWLVGTLAKDFGLLAPEQQLVPVYLNDRFYGLHRFVEPIDESFLRRNLRMPGNVFRADTAERGDYFKGVPREVFANPHIWDRAAANDRPGAFGTSLLAEFLRDLNSSDFEGHERFMSWLDPDELSRLLAFLLLVGDPYHMSGVHNQFWYEDPTSGKLHPIVWDVRLLELEKPPPRANINRFWRAALKDPRIWDGAMREIAKWVEGDKLLKLAEERLNAASERLAEELEYDTLRAGIIPPVGDAQAALATLRKNVEMLREWTTDARVRMRVELEPPSEHSAFVVDLLVEGRAPCVLGGFGYDKGSVFEGFWSNDLTADSNRDGQWTEADRWFRVRDDMTSFGPVEPVPLLPGCGGVAQALQPAAAHYRFFVGAGARAGELTGVTPYVFNALTRAPVAVEFTDERAPILSAGGWHMWQYQPARSESVSLSGEVHREHDLVLDVGDTLSIASGTTILLAPNVSWDIHGHVLAIGTAEKPITIRRANPELPWGVIALQGSGASGSRFEHVRFIGGGGGQLGNVEYKGSVCVHNAEKVVFDHCEFADNVRCDDLINVVKGSADVTNCWFHDANADSIDYDMSGGLVAHNKIERSGNDGLDLMTCWPRVIGNEITGSGDKGISIGEGSSPLVFDNVIRGCVRGIEVKDRSAPIVLHDLIEGCEQGVYAHLKNWRYGEAGWPKLVRTVVAGNESDYLAENAARRTLAAAQLGPASDQLPHTEDLGWLLRELGIRASASSIGPIDGYELAEPLAPLYQASFEENFVQTTDGWIADGLVARLYKRDHDLVASFDDERGWVSTAVDWDLTDAAREYVLVLEAAGDAVEKALVRVQHDSTMLANTVAIDPDPATYRYTAIELPPARYHELAISAEPTAARSRLRLHTWRVLAWPREGER